MDSANYDSFYSIKNLQKPNENFTKERILGSTTSPEMMLVRNDTSSPFLPASSDHPRSRTQTKHIYYCGSVYPVIQNNKVPVHILATTKQKHDINWNVLLCKRFSIPQHCNKILQSTLCPLCLCAPLPLQTADNDRLRLLIKLWKAELLTNSNPTSKHA